MALTYCVTYCLAWPLSVSAQDDFPDESQLDRPPAFEELQQQQEAQRPVLPADKAPPTKKGKWWKLGLDKVGDKNERVPEEKIIEVGPRQVPTVSDPLVRLPARIDSGTGSIVMPGIYLVRQRILNEETRQLELFQGKQHLLSVAVQKTGEEAAEPVEPISKKHPMVSPITVKAVLSADGQSITFTFWEGSKKYQSLPLPTAIDTRPQLRY